MLNGSRLLREERDADTEGLETRRLAVRVDDDGARRRAITSAQLTAFARRAVIRLVRSRAGEFERDIRCDGSGTSVCQLHDRFAGKPDAERPPAGQVRQVEL